MGRLMDEGWSVVIFPEGEQRIGGPMLPFQSGTGMLAVESHTPVVPVHLVSEARRRRFRTRVAVRFGAPLTFPRHLLPRRHAADRGRRKGAVSAAAC